MEVITGRFRIRGNQAVDGLISLVQGERHADDIVTVRVEYQDETIEGSADTFFDALIEVRRVLESCGASIECYGTMLNVYPSPMIRSMGDGRNAYRLTLGRPASSSDLVDIFDRPSIADMEYATVEEQEKFYDCWLASLSR